MFHKKYFLLGGVFRLTEVALEKALLWDICLLHMNELPFKQFFKYCDASGADDWETSSKSPTFIGHIGKNFKHKLFQKPPVAFRRIPGKVGVYPLDFVKSLNNDGRYLYFISHAIQDGVVPQYLAKKIIGHTHKAR